MSTKDALDGRRVPASAVFGAVAVGLEAGSDGADGGAGLVELEDAVDGGSLLSDAQHETAAVLVEVVGTFPAEGLAAEEDALGAKQGEGVTGALGGGFALPLGDGGEDVEDETTAGGASVDGVVDGEQREAGGEVVVDQVAEVADVAREAVELGDEQAVGVAGVEDGESAHEAWAAERLRGEPGVLA